MPLLTVNNISMSFGERRVLDGVDFRVNKGDKIAFVGDNGAGKSTLFKIIKGVYEPEAGEVIVHGNTIVGFLSQNMEEQDLSDTALKPKRLVEVESGLRETEALLSAATDAGEIDDLMKTYSDLSSEYEAMGGADYEYRMNEALAGLGLKDLAGRDDYSGLSGGEKMRVCLARLIVERPDVLLLDEPTNHLDIEAVEWLEDFLKSYKGAVFIITHDRYFIDSIANRVIELDGGHITEYKGGYTDYKEQKEEFIKTQRALIENLSEEYERQLGVKQTMLSHRNISGYHQREKVVNKLAEVLEEQKSKMPQEYAKMSFNAIPQTREGRSDKILMTVQNISKCFDDKFLFTDVSFELKASDKIFLCGPNGCGKTTLLNMLIGRAGGFDGTVLISSQATCGYMGQFVPFDDEELSCYEELISRDDMTVTEARSLLARFGFRGDDAFKQIKVLSGGERSRLYLCCLLKESPDILFLDEPTNHLDINSREILEDAIKAYDGAVICVSHDRFYIEKCADKILGFIDKKVLEYDQYRFYRNAYKQAQETKSEESAKPVKKEAEKPKVKDGKITGRIRNKMREVEKEIKSLENEQKEIEKTFGDTATGKDYQRYADISDKLDLLYEEYISLSEELN
ncbi:MAG: ABC-F family ATP-binding cassette domain-containing protein [Saccharofermentans sp.]|nr:ABC-F family ATP-binding cassette domain-containing protein [Saccharofermentans sp.]